MKVRLFILLTLHFVTSSRDFYVGMFKKDDLLVATDTLYKDRIPFRLTRATYGRLFKCNITYFRVVDRLGYGRVPRVEITRGGLRKKYVVLRITSGYNLPLSVNIYVGCQNKYNFTRSTYIKRLTKPTISTTPAATTKSAVNAAATTADTKDHKDDNKDGTSPAAGADGTTPAAAADGQDETTTAAAAAAAGEEAGETTVAAE